MKIAIGLSGGVDSAVSAALLKEQGHEVIGVFMKNWSDDFGLTGNCPWEQDQKDAEAVAKHLGIEFLSYNFELQYRDRVIEYFFNEYAKGRTPNPDILCNSEIKFNVFLKKCLQELQINKIATGHYARVRERLATDNRQGVISNAVSLLKGLDINKDQSYFLCRLTQEELSKSIFPIGEYTKPQVRELARKFKIPVAEKKDSQGICFIGKINVKQFIEQELGSKPGDIIDIDTKKLLGKHNGLWFYTIGQREGLGLSGGPWFVVKKELETNIVFVARGKDNPALFTKDVVLADLNILNKELLLKSLDNLEVSLRYRQKPALSKVLSFNTLVLSENNTQALLSDTKNISTETKLEKLKLSFQSPQRGVAPGQFGCIYVGDEVVASGVIVENGHSGNYEA